MSKSIIIYPETEVCSNCGFKNKVKILTTRVKEGYRVRTRECGNCFNKWDCVEVRHPKYAEKNIKDNLKKNLIDIIKSF